MLVDVLGLDQPWLLVDVLARLVDAVEHGLKNHDCARHGWELDAGCLDRARAAWLAKRRKP